MLTASVTANWANYLFTDCNFKKENSCDVTSSVLLLNSIVVLRQKSPFTLKGPTQQCDWTCLQTVVTLHRDALKMINSNRHYQQDNVQWIQTGRQVPSLDTFTVFGETRLLKFPRFARVKAVISRAMFYCPSMASTLLFQHLSVTKLRLLSE